MAAYAELLDISNAEELMLFLGSREPSEKNVISLSSKLGISKDDAGDVVTQLSSLLIGDLR